MRRGVEGRFPAAVYGHGEEPDPRFSLADERTFLAWIRTSLALMAAALAVEALHVGIGAKLRTTVAVLLVLAGIGSVGQAWAGWASSERALRLKAPLPASDLKPVLLVILLVIGVCLAVGLLL
jgi:putative membrane protein